MNPIASYSEADWDRLMNLMVKGPFLAMKFAWPHLTRRPGGRIIVTASTVSLEGAPYKAAYVAAKHAVLGLVKVAALEGAAAGLTANAVAPGWMHTPLTENQIRDHMRLRGISRDDVIAGMAAEQPAQAVRRDSRGRRAHHLLGRRRRICDQRRLHSGRHRHARRLRPAGCGPTRLPAVVHRVHFPLLSPPVQRGPVFLRSWAQVGQHSRAIVRRHLQVHIADGIVAATPARERGPA